MVIEKPYVDRHYLEEYGAYYFSSLRNGGPTTTRLHFFDTEFDRQKLSEWVQDAADGDPAKRPTVAARRRHTPSPRPLHDTIYRTERCLR